MEEYSMIKKGCLFAVVVMCSLFALTGCPKKAEEKKLEVNFSEIDRDFASLHATGFVPPVVRIGETYVNDKIESKSKTLSYEYYYKRIEDGVSDDEKRNVFKVGNSFHTATIQEEDAGDASKTKLKYEKLKDVNGGELCIGTKFLLGLIVKDYNGQELYKSVAQFHVTAPQSDVKAEGSLKVSIPGDHTLSKKPAKVKTVESSGSRTTYEVEGVPAGTAFSLNFGESGKTASVILK